MSTKKKTSRLWGRRAHGMSGVVARWELRPVEGAVGCLTCVVRMVSGFVRTGLAGWTARSVFTLKA
jgi:hypothetical protein